jgi:hypothetical protein
MTDDTQDPQQPKKPRKPAAKKAAPKRTKNPAPKNNTPTPPGKKAAARKVAAKKAAKVVTKATDSNAKENAAKAVSALLGEAKRAVGRPTLYSDDLIPQMLAFFNIETERIEDGDPIRDKEGNVVLDKEGNVVCEKVKVTNKYPTIERFASRIGVSRDTLHHWATAKLESGDLLHPEFSDTYTRCRDLQTALLVEGGLEGNYEARIVQFALTNISGWRTQIDTVVEGTVAVASKEELDEIYNRGMDRSRQAREAAKLRQLSGTVPGAVTGVLVQRAADEDADADE